jgi:hypothetical protein
MRGDRELLAAAAKAADLHANMWAKPGELLEGKGGWVQFIGHGHCVVWNPLTHDDDALRLAVKLKMRIEPMFTLNGNRYSGINVWPTGRGDCAGIDESPDPLIATRRAIVKAAAALAGSQP